MSLLILPTQAESDAYSRDSSRFPRRRPWITNTPHAIGPVPSLSGYVVAYRWRSRPRVRRDRASSPQGGSSNGCCLCSYYCGPINVPLFSQTHYWHEVGILKEKYLPRGGTPCRLFKQQATVWMFERFECVHFLKIFQTTKKQMKSSIRRVAGSRPTYDPA